MSLPTGVKIPVSTKYASSHILNPRFKYVHSTKTDIAKTFERIRNEQLKGKQ